MIAWQTILQAIDSDISNFKAHITLEKNILTDSIIFCKSVTNSMLHSL